MDQLYVHNDTMNGSYSVHNANATVVNEDMEALVKFESVVGIVVPVFFSIIFVIGFVGNILVIVVVVSESQMRNTTNLLIINLAIADISFILFCVPFTATQYSMTTWPFGVVFCKIHGYVINVTAYASVYTLVFMSLDRYLAVVHAIRSMTIRTLRNALIATVLMWIILLAVNSPVLLNYEVFPYSVGQENRTTCIPMAATKPIEGKIFYGTFFIFAYLLPLSVVCLFYGFMIKRLLYGVVPGGSVKTEANKSKKRVTKMVVIIVIIFALCWLPIHLMYLIQYYHADPRVSYSTIFITMKIPSTCLAYMNSCVNPILYAFLSENFRKSFRKLLCFTPKGARPLRVEFEKTTARCLENTRTTTVNGEKCL